MFRNNRNRIKRVRTNSSQRIPLNPAVHVNVIPENKELAWRYQDDSWDDNNLMHIKALEDDYEAGEKLVQENIRIAQELSYYIEISGKNKPFRPTRRHSPEKCYDFEKKYQVFPIYFAIMGSSFNTVKYLTENFAKCPPVHMLPYITHEHYHQYTVFDRDNIPLYNFLNIATISAIYCFKKPDDFEDFQKFYALFSENKFYDTLKTTPVHYACMSGNLGYITSVPRDAINLSLSAEQHVTLKTPLHFACQYGNEEIIKYLLKFENANVTKTDSNGNTCLHYAARCCDNAEIIDLIINKAARFKPKSIYVCIKNSDGVAVEHCHFETAKYLIKFCNSLNIRLDIHKSLLLHLATQKNDHKMISLLINRGWDVENRNHKGQTPLHIATEKNNLSLIKIFLKKNANIEARDDNGFTPLLIAAFHDNVDTLKYLMHKNASLSSLTFYGETVLNVAAKYNSTNVLKYFLELNGGNKFDISFLYIPNIDLDTPLHNIVRNGNLDLLKLIIHFYNDINIQNNDLQTPLHIAGMKGYFEIFRLLLQTSTASINSNDKYQKTPLFYAFNNNSSEMTEYLMENCAKDILSKSRKAYLETALATRNVHLLKCLFKNEKDDEDEYEFKEERDNQECLKQAITLRFTDGVSFLLSLKQWKRLLRRQAPTEAYLGSQSPIQLLIEYMPEMVNLVLDKCRCGSENVTHTFEFLDDNYYIKMNKSLPANEITGSYFIPYVPFFTQKDNGDIVKDPNCGKLKLSAKCRKNDYKEIVMDHPLSLMLKHKQYDLLSHEVVESYIYMKWNNFAKWGYYFYCFYHSLLVIFLTLITINLKPVQLMTTEEKEKINSSNACLMTPSVGWIVAIFGLMHLILTFYKYARDFKMGSRLLDFFIVGLIFFASQPICQILNANNQWSILIILNFCAWFSLLNIFRKLPRLGVYVLMASVKVFGIFQFSNHLQVAHTVTSFLRFAPIFIMFLLPFVGLFHVMLGEERGIFAFFDTFVRTLVMMIGEYDYNDTIASKSSLVATAMFCFFLFMVTIFLMNLLIGLAVSDISKTLEKASKTRVRLQIETIFNVETQMPEFLRRKIWRGFREIKIRSNRNNEQDDKCFKFQQWLKWWFKWWFKWWGLPKSEIKEETNKDNFSTNIKILQNQLNEQKEYISKMNSMLETMQTNISQIMLGLEKQNDIRLNLSKNSLHRDSSVTSIESHGALSDIDSHKEGGQIYDSFHYGYDHSLAI